MATRAESFRLDDAPKKVGVAASDRSTCVELYDMYVSYSAERDPHPAEVRGEPCILRSRMLDVPTETQPSDNASPYILKSASSGQSIFQAHHNLVILHEIWKPK